MRRILLYVWKTRLHFVLEFVLTIRGIFFIGFKYTCPCCGWKLRAFTHKGISFRARYRGYCPRCHVKARHRRNWLYLEQKTNLFTSRLRLLHISPEYGFSRRFIKMTNLDYIGADIYDCPNINVKMDLVSSPFRSNIFDAIICIHVLEHIENDIEAMRELYRVLKPGGWAVVSMPTRLDQKTYEDPMITLPEERERAFGEAAHVRIYGYDVIDQLQGCGFNVRLDRADQIGINIREKFGLLDDENIFHCTKAEIN